MKTVFEVEIRDINVGDKYYDFQYQVTRDGEIVSGGEICEDHSWGACEEDKKKFKEMLKEGFAVDLAMEKVIH